MTYTMRDAYADAYEALKATQTAHTKICIYEQALTDGSTVYGVVAGEVTFDCPSEAVAEELANTIERLSLNAQFDGWNRVQRDP